MEILPDLDRPAEKKFREKRTRDVVNQRELAVYGRGHKTHETRSGKDHNRDLEGTCHGQ